VFDTNGDGGISCTELHHMLDKMGIHLSKADMKRVMKFFDPQDTDEVANKAQTSFVSPITFRR
jgi:Ca2+-binding EF-hand superfamily protein